jgi:hypothetical protein
MTGKIDLGRIYGPSDDVVVREIEGEIVIVPLTSGIGDLEDECFTFDEWGRAVWSKIDGSRPLATVVQELLDDYDAPDELLQRDVVGLLQELYERRMIVEKD